MNKYLKNELRKIIWSKSLYKYLFLIVFYIAFVYIIYLSSNTNIKELILNYNEEYFILYLITSLFYSSSTLNDEYQYKTIYFLEKNNLLVSKIIIIIINIIMIFLISFIINITIFIILKENLTFILIKNIIAKYIKMLPLLIIINQIALLFSTIFNKSSYALGFTYIFYIGVNYLNNIILKHNNPFNKIFITLYWNLNNILINITKFEMFIYLVLFSIGIILITFFINKRKNI